MPETITSSANLIWNKLKALGMPNAINQYENGIVALPALALGASTTLNVTLSGSFPDNNYQVKFRAISGTSALTMLQITSFTKTTNSVSVTIKANGLASLAGLLLVDAHKNA
jgi:hypothetical protein